MPSWKFSLEKQVSILGSHLRLKEACRCQAECFSRRNGEVHLMAKFTWGTAWDLQMPSLKLS
jgi:hypothetical protein